MQPNPIRTDTNDFANDTFARRLPQMIQEIQANNHYPSTVNAALEDLAENLSHNAPLPPPILTVPDAQTWLEAYEQHKGDTWQASEFLYAETYFFHLVNEIVKYWQAGIDPYKESKDAEVRYSNTAFRNRISALPTNPDSKQRLSELIPMSLWGNRVDLSLPEVMKTQTQDTAEEDLLVDEQPQAIERLLNAKGTVHIITDNFGTELAMDLALADSLLELAIPVTLHVKMHPTYVSDATAKDVFSIFDKFRGYNTAYFHRLEDAWVDGRLQVAPNFFWNSPHFLNKLPQHLMKLFADANLLIFKGDVNYRRAFFDTIWPVDKPASEIVNYLPAPALFLRTLKSDCLAGVPKALAEQAEAANPNWRRLGKYGVIQYINP